MLRYREVYVKLTIPCVSMEDAKEQANHIVNARLSCMRADETLLPIKAEVSSMTGGTLMLDHPSLQEKRQ